MAVEIRPTILKLPVKTKILRTSVLHFREIDSTNRYLLDNADKPHGTVVMADYQTAGRGRFNRVWQSPPEAALLFSVLLKEIPSMVRPTVFPYLAAVGVYNCLRQVKELVSGVSVKWPNDVLIYGKKVCGILMQGNIMAGCYQKLVIGIGVNVNQEESFFTKDLNSATSISIEAGRRFDRMSLFNGLLSSLDEMLIMLQERGAKPIITMWQKACDSMEREIAVDNGNEIYRGIFEGLADDGAMQLKTKAGLKRFYAGDVTVIKE